MKRIENVSRRKFLQGVVSAGALVLCVRAYPETLWAARSASVDPLAGAGFRPNVYLVIARDGSVSIIAHRSEMGTGIRTSLPRVVADELDADWTRVRIEQAVGDPKYGTQDTDGSKSVRLFFDVMRQAGASARMMLVSAAAQQWKVPVGECATDLHVVVHRPTGRKIGYGELAPAAAKLPVPKKEEVALKARSAWRYIGKEAKNYDIEELCSGKAMFGQDMRMDGMLYASLERPPVLGGKIKSLDDKETLSVAGVRQVVPIEPFTPPHGFQALGGVAVLADSTWSAMQGRKKLKIEWDHGANASYNSDAYKRELQETVRKPCKVVRDAGDVDAEFSKGGKVVEAEYYTPHLAHAPMEPPAAVAEYRDGKVTAWVCTQNPQAVQGAVAKALGIKNEDVLCHVTFLGGGFGRKSKPDYAVEAAVLSRKTGRPVKVVWTREDDLHFDYYHTVAAMYLKAALGPDGKPTAWLHRSAFPPINSMNDVNAVYGLPRDLNHGLCDVPFAIPNLRVENGAAKAHVRIGWLRSVGNVYHAFAVQSFADELAHAAGRDSLEYLLALLGPDRILERNALPADYPNYGASYEKYPIDTGRLRRVLELAAEKAGWGKQKLGKGSGMGLAVHRCFLTYAATVVRVDVSDRGEIKIRRVDTAFDAGTVVNPERVRAQVEGSAVFGASLGLMGEITATNGVIDQSNFHNYPVARMKEAPAETHVHLLPSDAPPAGAGEPGVPPFAPALCNAIFAATGKRIRELPLSRAKLV
jgi:isoquinoline 1-oxidoreductase beta subunit